jgi:hypothetical protein
MAEAPKAPSSASEASDQPAETVELQVTVYEAGRLASLRSTDRQHQPCTNAYQSFTHSGRVERVLLVSATYGSNC